MNATTTNVHLQTLLFDDLVEATSDDAFGDAPMDRLRIDEARLTGFSSVRVVDRAGRDPGRDTFDYECRDARRVTLATLPVGPEGLRAGDLRILVQSAYTLEGLLVIQMRDQISEGAEWRAQPEESAAADRAAARLAAIGATATPVGLTFGMIGVERGETVWWIEGEELLIEAGFDGSL